MNYVNTNDVILLKKNGKNKTYVVDSITHKIDYDVSIKVATTHIRLKELKD